MPRSRRTHPGRTAATILVTLAVLVAACSGGDDGKTERGTSTTGSPSSTSPPTSTAPSVGDEITGERTRLISPSEPETRQIDAEAACRTFLERPDGSCEIVRMQGGIALWTIEAEPEVVGADEHVWRLRVWAQSETMPDGGWRVALQLPEGGPPADRPSFAAVSVKSVDVTGDGSPELLVGYRAGGTGQFESYDVITFALGTEPRVAAHREQLHKGSVTITGSSIVDYSADQSSPECCPETATRTVITSGREGTFRIAAVDEVPIDEQPADLFA